MRKETITTKNDLYDALVAEYTSRGNGFTVPLMFRRLKIEIDYEPDEDRITLQAVVTDPDGWQTICGANVDIDEYDECEDPEELAKKYFKKSNMDFICAVYDLADTILMCDMSEE